LIVGNLWEVGSVYQVFKPWAFGAKQAAIYQEEAKVFLCQRLLDFLI
jgi:hypothetical protein